MDSFTHSLSLKDKERLFDVLNHKDFPVVEEYLKRHIDAIALQLTMPYMDERTSDTYRGEYKAHRDVMLYCKKTRDVLSAFLYEKEQGGE